MNRLIMKLLAVAIVVVTIFSCASDDKTAAKPINNKLLESPSFQGLTDSINESPENVELLLRRATLLSQNNLHQAATPDYKKAWEITNDEGIALEYASNLLLSSRVADAMRLLKESAVTFPENTEFTRRLAEIYLQNGQNEKALAEYNRITAADSTNFEAWFDKGTLLARLKDTAAAVRALETSFTLLPINYTGMALANIYVAQKDPRALEICDILLERDSAGVQTEPVYMKGMYYTAIKDNANAIKQFDECIKRDWKMTDAYIEKGIIFYEMKQYQKALDIFNMAATVSNTDADAYFWMGRCFEATGKRDQAIINYERALALDDSFTEARTALQRLNS